MKKSFGTLAIFLLILTSMTPFVQIEPTRAERTITVPDDYPTIQKAVYAANEGDTIRVKKGLYYGRIYIDKPLTLIGEDQKSILDGRQRTTVVFMASDNVTITGFTVQSSGTHYDENGCGVLIDGHRNITVYNNRLIGNFDGVHIRESSENSIIGNYISNCFAGIHSPYSSSNNTIVNNTITENYYGISMHDCINFKLRSNVMFGNQQNFDIDGKKTEHYIHDIDLSNTVDGKPIYYWIDRRNEQIPLGAGQVNLINCVNITVEHLKLRRNYIGILLFKCTNCRIANNDITENNYGIRLLDSSYNDIVDNNITMSDNVGIILWYGSMVGLWPWYNSPILATSNNRIYNNEFVNDKQVKYYKSTNIWDNGYPSGGNYWSDYSGVDEYSGPNQDQPGSDGIGDTPYVIDENNVDHYPLMRPIPHMPSDLIKQYCPVLIYDEQEQYYLCDFDYDNTDIEDNPENYNSSWPKKCYTHIIEFQTDDKDYLCLQYWFYYCRDNGIVSVKFGDDEYTFFDHNHDWESIFIFLEKTDADYTPRWVLYFHHTNINLLTDEEEDCYTAYEWKRIEKRDSRPIVHVSRGKHACYAKTFLDIGLCWINIHPFGDLPIIEACDGGWDMDYYDFQIEQVDEVDSSWPDKFGGIDAPWTRKRWNDPEFLLAFPTVKNSFTLIGMEENKSKLYLHLYYQGQHTGMNYETNETELGIPEVYYQDFGKTTILVIPSNMTEFELMVDATCAEEEVEIYEITIRTVRNGEIIDEESETGFIEKNKQKQCDALLDEQGEILAIPEFQTWIILLLLMISTMLAIVLRRRKQS